MLWPFKQIKEWFAFPQKQKDLAAEILCTRCQNVLKNHAVCIAWDAKGIRVMDYQMRVFPLGTDITAIVKALFPDAQTYCYCNEEGFPTTPKYLVRMTA